MRKENVLRKTLLVENVMMERVEDVLADTSGGKRHEGDSETEGSASSRSCEVADLADTSTKGTSAVTPIDQVTLFQTAAYIHAHLRPFCHC